MGRRRTALVYGTAAVVLVLDQLTKWLVVTRLAGREPVRVIGTFVQFRYTTNPGGAFSLLTGFPLFFGLMAIAIMVAIGLYARRTTSGPVLFALGLLLGGALGNFGDRLLRGDGLLNGEVVDFVDVGSFPVFNVADSCITVGAVLLAVLLTFTDRQPDTPREDEAPEGGAQENETPEEGGAGTPSPSTGER